MHNNAYQCTDEETSSDSDDCSSCCSDSSCISVTPTSLSNYVRDDIDGDDDDIEDNEVKDEDDDDDDVMNTDCEDTTLPGTSIEPTCSLLQSVQTEESSTAEEPLHLHN